jgi:hypothetical protein
MGTLTQEQRQLLKQCGGDLLRLVDPDTNKEYVLLPVEAFQQLQTPPAELHPREMYPLLHRVLQEEGWDEPHMDEYNRYG